MGVSRLISEGKGRFHERKGWMWDVWGREGFSTWSILEDGHLEYYGNNYRQSTHHVICF